MSAKSKLESGLKPYVSAGTACAVVGVKAATLRAWRNRGLLKVGRKKTAWTLYSERDIYAIAAMKELVDSGVQAELAGEIAELCGLNGAAIGPQQPGWLVFSKGKPGDTVFVANRDELYVAAMVEGPVKIVVDVGKIVTEVFNELVIYFVEDGRPTEGDET